MKRKNVQKIMFINKIQIQNFKRFSNLTIDLSECAEPPKLVLLVGANGSGKSCIFDAFEFINLREQINQEYTRKDWPLLKEESPYFLKDPLKEQLKIKLQGSEGELELSPETLEYIQNTTPNNKLAKLNKLATYKFYGRTAFRYLPRLIISSIGSSEINLAKDPDKPKTFIDLDNRFENDVKVSFVPMIIDFLNEELSPEQRVFKSDHFKKKINQSLQRIFQHQENTKLKYTKFEIPLPGKPLQFLFKKGNSTMHYDLLSAGEKEIINILFNLYSRINHFQEAIYFFDELDLHLNTSLQESLLAELIQYWIPDNSQIWIASHSLGFVEYARKKDDAVIIDFDDKDFDMEQELKPADKHDLSIFTVPIPINSLESIIQLPSVVLCEGQDAKYYSEIQSEKKFLGLKDKFSIIQWVFNHSANGLIDRDFLLDEEINKLKVKLTSLKVLKYYSIENYLYHPNNIEEYFTKQNQQFDKALYISQIVEEKEKYLSSLITDYFVQCRNRYGIFSEKQDNWFIEREDSNKILEILKKNNFEAFYKFLPMKDCCKNLIQRQNLNKKALAQTNWFKAQIEEVLK